MNNKEILVEILPGSMRSNLNGMTLYVDNTLIITAHATGGVNDGPYKWRFGEKHIEVSHIDEDRFYMKIDPEYESKIFSILKDIADNILLE